ncbi:MAG: glycosyltransferase family 2 protein, partial [Thermodesulfovibrionales bacterium]
SWLVKLEEGFHNPRVACSGGKVEPFFEDIEGWPEWLHRRLYGFFTVVDYGSRRLLHYPDYPAGTNMAFRRSIFDQVGLFRHELGRTGESLLSMEETDLCLRVENAGYSIEYLPDAIVHHKVRRERLSQEWLKQRSYWQGVSAAVIEKSFSRGHIMLKSLKYVVFFAAAIIGSIGCRLLNKEKDALFFNCQSELCRGYLGKIWRS